MRRAFVGTLLAAVAFGPGWMAQAAETGSAPAQALSKEERARRFDHFYGTALKLYSAALSSEADRRVSLLKEAQLNLRNCLVLKADEPRAKRLLDSVEEQLQSLGVHSTGKSKARLTEEELALLEIELNTADANMAWGTLKFDEARAPAERAIAIAERYPSNPKAQQAIRDMKVLLMDIDKERARLREVAAQQSVADSKATAKARKMKESEEERLLAEQFKNHAEKLIASGDYDEARKLTQEFQSTHPDSPLPPQVLTRIKNSEKKALSKSMDDKADSQLLAVKRDQVPPETDNVITFPPGWKECMAKRPEPKAEPDPNAELLAQKVSLSFQESPLEEVAGYLKTITGMNVIVDPKVRDRKVTLDVLQMSLGRLLAWTCKLCDVSYTIKDEAIFFSDKEGVRDQLVSRAYDVADLLLSVKDLAPYVQDGTGKPVSEKGELSDEEGVSYGKPVKSRASEEGEELVNLIKSTVSPEIWDAPGQAAEQQRSTIRIRGTNLLVRTFPDTHREIAQLLQELREMRAILVSIVVRFITITNDFLETLNISWDSVPGAGTVPGSTVNVGYVAPPDAHSTLVLGNSNQADFTRAAGGLSSSGGIALSWTYFDDFQVAMVLNAVLKRRKGNVLTSPRLTCFNTQRANLVIGTFRNYVETISEGGEPTIAQAPSTIVLDVQPFVSADRRFITVVLRPTITETVSLDNFSYTIASTTTTTTGGVTTPEQRTIQQPTILTQAIRTTVSIPNGGSILIGGLSRATEALGYATFPIVDSIPLLRYLFRSWGKEDSRSSLILLVRAEVIDLEEEAARVH